MPANGSTQRRLAAIVAADVAGYTRLVGADEEGTLSSLSAHRSELIDPLLAEHGGRVANTAGDSLLLEFPSAVEAVKCAIAVQEGMVRRNEDVDPDSRIRFRVGINVGDVVAQGDDLLGEGVNVAARLEGIADPGGILLSRAARDQVRDKLDLTLDDQGEVEVKNIARPIRVFRVVPDGEAPRGRKPSPTRTLLRRPVLAAVALVAIIGAAYGTWTWMQPAIEPADPARFSHPLPEKSSLAVLPFNNLSDDQQQEYFADGLTDDLITDLSRLSGLFVISRNSSFTYKNKPVLVQQIAEELGVRYIVEGSVRRSADEIRVNAQLIDALTGHHIWADRYSGTPADVFKLQDNVVRQIVSALAVNLSGSESAVVGHVGTTVPEAYDAFLQGLARYNRLTPQSHKAAIGHFERAVALDPEFARAYAGLAAVYWDAIKIGWEVPMQLDLSWQEIFDKAKDNLAKALEDPNPLAFRVSAQLLLHHKRFDEAIGEVDKAIVLGPNDAENYREKAKMLVRAGRAQEAEAAAHTAMRLNPHYRASYLSVLGQSMFGQDKFEDAARVLARVAQRDSEEHESDSGYYLAAAYGHLGQIEAAREAVERYNLSARRIGWEDLTLGYVGRWEKYKNEADVARLREGLRKAGVPEGAAPLSEESEFLALVSEGDDGFRIAGAARIDAVAAKDMSDRGVTFVDVRSSGAYREGHIPGSLHLDLYVSLGPDKLRAHVAKGDEVVFYCFGESCYRSAHACAKALTWGFERVYYFAGGFPAWKKAGYPVETDE